MWVNEHQGHYDEPFVCATFWPSVLTGKYKDLIDKIPVNQLLKYGNS